MLQFPVNWNIPLLESRELLRLNLDDEWTLTAVWSMSTIGIQCLVSIDICRKTASEEMFVSGTFSFQETNGDILRKKFLTLVERGFSSTTLARFPFLLGMRDRFLILQGVVNITSSHGKNINDFESGECKKCILSKSLLQLSKDFERLLDPDTSCFADVILKCGDESIPVHKTVLFTRSPVFADMFSNPIRENNEVQICDLDASVLRALLIYMYTGTTPNLTFSLASELMLAAHKYLLNDLKRVCCGFLKDKISFQNVLRILALGDLLAEDLKLVAVDYICNKCTKFSDLEDTAEWRSLKNERPALTIDVLTSVVKARDEKLQKFIQDGSHSA